jgi:hypothetical protein
VPKNLVLIFSIFFCAHTLFSKESRKPRWPLPKASRGISSLDQIRITEYRNYLQSLTDTEIKEFTEDAKISFGNFGVNPTRVIVKFKDSQTEEGVLQSLQFKKPLTDLKSVETKVLQLPQGKNNLELLAHLGVLKEMEGVEYAYPDYKIKISTLPNDPEFSRQWDFHNTGETTAAGKGDLDADIDAPEAWAVSTGSRSVIVGVLDTGISYSNLDLKENIWSNPGETGQDRSGNDKSTNGIDDDGNGYVDDFRGWDFVGNDNDPMDEHGHGTHVAGTIGAVGNNGIGVAGVNWQVSLVPLQIFDSSGSGDLSGAMAALEYATRMGFPITNNSWGGGEFTQAFEDLLKANRDAGSLFVAAAGNDGSNNDTTPTYPASFQVENVISVAASDPLDQLANFSNYGKNTVHLAAPGVNIFSTYWDSDYYYESGTSMAAPHVAGAAALIKSVWPNLNYQQIKNKIIETVDVIYNPSFEDKTMTGGRLNLAAAVGGEPSPLPLRLSLKTASPKVGPLSGGTTLRLTGTGLSPDTKVTVGLKPCNNLLVSSQMALSCVTTRSAISGLHNVIATNPDGKKSSLSGAFRYHNPPTLSSISPVFGLSVGGNRVTLTGAQFGTGAKVRIGDKECTQVQGVSSTQVTCTVPSYEEGKYKVTVINQYGQESSEDVQYAYYTYPAPTVASISPSAGPLRGGNTVTINGTGFRSGLVARIGGLDCTNINLISETQITCLPPAKTQGTYAINILNSDTQQGTLLNAYTYRPAPQITSLSPNRGGISGGGVVTVNGTGFVTGAVVKVGAKVCTNPQVLSANQITCTIPANETGFYLVTATNPEGQTTAQTPSFNFETVAPRWVGTNGGTCITVCSAQNLNSKSSSEGANCTSGEVIPKSARGVINYVRGCSPKKNCSAQGIVSGATSQSRFCYGPGQRRNAQATDITMGCYCGL